MKTLSQIIKEMQTYLPAYGDYPIVFEDTDDVYLNFEPWVGEVSKSRKRKLGLPENETFLFMAIDEEE